MKIALKLLVVDDSIDDREYYITMLSQDESNEYLMQESDTADDALKKVMHNEYDCVLLDYNLPGHNGVWLIRELRLRNNNVPIILLTGGGSEQVAVDALKSGAQDYMPKSDITTAGLSKIIVQAIETMQEQRRLHDMVNVDPLTGLANRHQFFQKFNDAIERVNRVEGNIAVFFLDLNKFKPINDTYGHRAGDEVLKKAGSLLAGFGRPYDTVARLGGDEFILLIEHLDKNDAVDQCARLAERISEGFSNCTCQIDNTLLPLSVSIGVCIYPLQTADKDKIIELADMAMYRAKFTNDLTYSFPPDDSGTDGD